MRKGRQHAGPMCLYAHAKGVVVARALPAIGSSGPSLSSQVRGPCVPYMQPAAQTARSPWQGPGRACAWGLVWQHVLHVRGWQLVGI